MKRSRDSRKRLLASIFSGILVISFLGCSQPAAPTSTVAPKATAAREAKPEATAAKPVAKEAKPQEAKPAPKLTKLTVPYTAIGGGMTTLWVAKEKGLFEKYGLDVELSYIASSTTLVQAMTSGEIVLANTGANSVVSADLAGADVALIAGIVNVVVMSLYGQPSIQKIEDFKGKSIGVTRFGSNTDFAARFTLRKYGLEPDKDVAIIQTGGMPEIVAAMQSGGIDGGVLSPPTTIQGRKLGLREVVNIVDLKIPYSFIAFAVNRKYLADNREVVTNFMKAIMEAIAVAKKDKDFTEKVIAKYIKSDDKDVLEETYDIYVNKIFQRAPYATNESVQTILDEVARQNPKAKEAKPESFIDNSIIKGLEDSGFIKKLYE
ncbi:MAG: ABC transporter substrate-binding protein [Chloroflexi bacterium]|nr:ABC transporter substrate-binding protein [Chloroflexota bacterium]